VTKEKIIKLAKEYKHVDREGEVKKIPIDALSSRSNSPDNNVSIYLTRQAERCEPIVPKKVQKKQKC